MKERKYNIGDIFENRYGDKYEIIDRGKKIKIKFLNTGYTKYSDSKEVSNGIIKDPLKPTIYDVGYIGEINKKYNKKDYIYIMSYSIWSKMIFRCYSPKSEIKNPTYKNVTVCEEWHNFSNFVDWFYENYPKQLQNIKFNLDKDLLQLGVKNKIYSPRTCIFLPDKINAFFTNVQNKHNTSGCVGVSWKKKNNNWVAQINDFNTGKYMHLGSFKTKEGAHKKYEEYRKINADNVKKYLKSLNYLEEYIIEKVK